MENIIIVSAEDRDMVQRANIESESLMNLITFMINHDVDVGNERFQRYNEEYTKAFAAFETAKNMIEKKYLANLGAVRWNLSYDTCELTYEK